MAAPRLFVCVLVATLQVITPAFAQPRPVVKAPAAAAPVVRRPVAVINLDLTGDRQLIDFATEVNKVLDTHPALRVNGLLAPLYERIDDPDANKLLLAQRKLDESLSELANGNFPSAARAAKEGQEWLLSVTPSQAIVLYSELAFVRGKALLGDGKSSDARASFSLSQRLNTNRTIDTTREPPDVVAAYNAAKSTPAPTGRVDVVVGETSTQRGTVWIDGDDKGFAPNQYVITSGLHVVWVTDRDRETSGLEVDVKPGLIAQANVLPVSASFSLQLQRTRQELARAVDDGAKAVAMRRIAQIAGVKDALLLSLVNGKIVYQSWRSDDADRAPGFSRKHEKSAKDPTVKVLDDLAPPPVEEDPPGVVFPIPVDDTRWYQKPAYWAGIAFGTSLVAVGAYFLISALIPDTVTGIENVGIVNPEDRLPR